MSLVKSGTRSGFLGGRELKKLLKVWKFTTQNTKIEDGLEFAFRHFLGDFVAVEHEILRFEIDPPKWP